MSPLSRTCHGHLRAATPEPRASPHSPTLEDTPATLREARCSLSHGRAAARRPPPWMEMKASNKCAKPHDSRHSPGQAVSGSRAPPPQPPPSRPAAPHRPAPGEPLVPGSCVSGDAAALQARRHAAAIMHHAPTTMPPQCTLAPPIPTPTGATTQAATKPTSLCQDTASHTSTNSQVTSPPLPPGLLQPLVPRHNQAATPPRHYSDTPCGPYYHTVMAPRGSCLPAVW
ncbi:hypothetical protein E2C01_069076 [Portunus trituberculatus]|uniref:Uncharacterized protein n=1 Tax=Portunus trituberculatus TaxID=210409 RepID=A0A5B7HP56_PORTR|nr:hypothetical protein [Portunus trituberculatus]